LALVCATLASAQAPDYQPLLSGWEWTFITGQGGDLSEQVAGQLVIHGHLTTEIHCVETVPIPQVYHNYWTKDVDGNVYLHGAWNDSGFVLSYEPPILWVAPPLAVGKTWSSTPQFFDGLDDANPGDFHTLAYEVAALADVTVPAGVFAAANIVFVMPWTVTARDGLTYDLCGRRLPDDAVREDGRWVAEGVGRVKETDWELASYIDPLPNETSTWSDVKRLFQ